MTSTDKTPSREAQLREERLAAKLRENLRRRKVQAKALSPAAGKAGAAKGEDASGKPLSKPSPKS